MPRKSTSPTKPKDDAFTAAAKRAAAAAMKTLTQIHKDESKETAARVTAATKIIEYAYGKPSSGEAANITQVNVILDKTDQKL